MTAPKRRRLTTQRMYEIYAATRDENAPIEDILQKYGLDHNDLEAIEDAIESGEIDEGPGRKAKMRDEWSADDDPRLARRARG